MNRSTIPQLVALDTGPAVEGDNVFVCRSVLFVADSAASGRVNRSPAECALRPAERPTPALRPRPPDTSLACFCFPGAPVSLFTKWKINNAPSSALGKGE